MAVLPEEFKVESMRFTNNSSETETTSQSLITLIRKLPSQRWEFTLRSTLTDMDKADVINGYLSARKQLLDTVDVELPRYSENPNISSTTTTATGGIGDNSISVASGSGITAGKFFTFSGHDKVYIVTDIAGTSLSFAPNLKRSVASAETLTFDGVVFTMKLRGRPLEFNADSSTQSVRFELDLVEVL